MDGQSIDEAYFKGHLTVVSFMYVGCPPCMNEISLLNKLSDDYAAKGVQVLCVAMQTRQQMDEFNNTGKGTYGLIRKALKIDSIRYTIQPACSDAPDNITKSGSDSDQHISIGRQCSTIKEVYGITSYPTIFFVDKDGIIRKTKKGGPGKMNDMAFYAELKKEVDAQL